MLLETLFDSGSKEDVIISFNTFTFILSCDTNICLPTKWSKIETIDLYFVPFMTDNEHEHERSMAHSHFMIRYVLPNCLPGHKRFSFCFISSKIAL